MIRVELLVSPRKYLLLILMLALAIRAAMLEVAWRNDSASSGYPAFLPLSGVTEPLGYGIAQIVGILLDLLLVYLTYVLGARLVSTEAGLWAALMQALSALAIGISAHILTDSIFALLLTLIILVLARHFYEGQWWPVALAATLMAAAVYVRPIGTLFVPVAVGVPLFLPRRLSNAWRRCRDRWNAAGVLIHKELYGEPVHGMQCDQRAEPSVLEGRQRLGQISRRLLAGGNQVPTNSPGSSLAVAASTPGDRLGVPPSGKVVAIADAGDHLRRRARHA
jgi:hypothetical protein